MIIHNINAIRVYVCVSEEGVVIRVKYIIKTSIKLRFIIQLIILIFLIYILYSKCKF